MSKFDRLRSFLVIHRVFTSIFPLFEFVQVRRSSTDFDQVQIPSCRLGEPGAINPRILLDFSTLEELGVRSGTKVPRVHGAVAPGKPLVAAYYSLKTTLYRFGRSVFN